MTDTPRTIALCSCEDTMRLAPDTVKAGCGAAHLTVSRHLCRSDLDTFRRLAAAGPVTIACTQEAPLFSEVAEDEALGADLTFVNVRETAGWSKDGHLAAPKMAALLAAAEFATPPPSTVTIESEGTTLIYGSDQTAIDAAMRLKDRLDITVLLTPGARIVPPRNRDFPIAQGRITSLKGRLGAFELSVDVFATARASSRDRLAFETPRNGATSKADIVIDLTGGPTLVSASDLRSGYLRANPLTPLDVERLLFKAADLVGTFDKPRFVDIRTDLCAHSRSRITGCTRCLDLCPAGAISPNGDHVLVDQHICAGCGQCAASCPTGAVTYALPPVEPLLARLRAMLRAYHAAGGEGAQILFHDASHGADLIDTLARQGDGLPARTIPVEINEVTQLGLDVFAALFAYGAASVHLLMRAKPRHDISGLRQTLTMMAPLLSTLGYGDNLVATIETDDPFLLTEALESAPRAHTISTPSSVLATGGKRDILRVVLRALHEVAPNPLAQIALPDGAMFGRVHVRADGCTLCLACVSACPTKALGDNDQRPELTFDESLCVQCGLCAKTCPEKVITLEPRIDFSALASNRIALKTEEPFCCITCGKAFGTKSTIERIIAKLEDKHWMFQGANRERLDLIRMCEDCRIEAAVNSRVDPFAAAPRPRPRTTEDYIQARDDAHQTPEERERQMRDKIDRGEA